MAGKKHAWREAGMVVGVRKEKVEQQSLARGIRWKEGRRNARLTVETRT
jgi:hypothetical protein